MAEKIVEKLIKQFEINYLEQKKKSAQEFHDAIQQIIMEQKPDIFIILYILKMIEFEVIKENYELLFKEK